MEGKVTLSNSENVVKVADSVPASQSIGENITAKTSSIPRGRRSHSNRRENRRRSRTREGDRSLKKTTNTNGETTSNLVDATKVPKLERVIIIDVIVFPAEILKLTKFKDNFSRLLKDAKKISFIIDVSAPLDPDCKKPTKIVEASDKSLDTPKNDSVLLYHIRKITFYLKRHPSNDDDEQWTIHNELTLTRQLTVNEPTGPNANDSISKYKVKMHVERKSPSNAKEGEVVVAEPMVVKSELIHLHIEDQIKGIKNLPKKYVIKIRARGSVPKKDVPKAENDT